MGMPRLAKNMRVSSMADSASASMSPVGAKPNTSRPYCAKRAGLAS